LALGAAPAEAAAGTPTAAAAERVVRRWFDAHGIAAPGLVLDNGSGLSRSERITPHALARLLQVAWAGRHASDFVASLPLAGEDGTMRARLKDSPAGGWARLKTGTLRNVAALAGYVRDAEGRPWAVAMMINHERARAARPALDALVDALARSPRPGAWLDAAAGTADAADGTSGAGAAATTAAAAGALAQPAAAGEVP
jgi:D-alanyl-D-alanine carboxypeptidase/D-alanyl-D-alanine-endopeptidase (penicillin-binding protein 4)